jgi:hypothetical protein
VLTVATFHGFSTAKQVQNGKNGVSCKGYMEDQAKETAAKRRGRRRKIDPEYSKDTGDTSTDTLERPEAYDTQNANS